MVRERWWRKVILSGAIVVLVFAPLAYAAVHPWAYFSIGLFIALLSIFLLLVMLTNLFRAQGNLESIPRPPLWGFVLAFLGLVSCQIVYLPESIAGILSPQALYIRALGNGYGLADAFPLSLNAYATQLELLKLLPAVMLFYLLVYTINRRAHIRLLAGVILAVALFEVIYGVVTLRSHWIWGWKNVYTGHRLCGTFINSNNLAGFLTMAICLGFGQFLALQPPPVKKPPATSSWRRIIKLMEAERTEPQCKRYLLLFMLIVLTAGLILSGSRGGMLSLVFGFVMMGGLVWSRGQKRGTVIIMVVFLVTALAYSLLLGGAPALARFCNLEDRGRTCAFTGALAIFGDFPLVGTGLATFGDVFYQHEPPQLRGVRLLYAHSDWLQLLAETGTLGFGLLLSAWLLFLYRLIERWQARHDFFATGLGLGGLGALLAASFHALADFNMHIPADALLLAAVAAITYLSVHSRARGHLEFFSYPALIFPRHRIALSVILVSLIVLQLVYLKTVRRYWQAEQVAPTELNSTVKPPRLTAVDFQKAAQFNPVNSAYYSQQAAALSQAGIEPHQAAKIEQLLKQAIFLAPANWTLRLQLANFYLQHFAWQPARNIPRGLQELSAAIRLFPESGLLHFHLGTALAWAEHYFTGLVPPGLQGQSRQVLERAVLLDRRLKNAAAKYFPKSS